jgi:hypothetical protein
MGYAISSSKHIFGMGALLQQGILVKYLDVKCPTEHYKICQYKESLAGYPDSDYFIWMPESPLYATGGWEANKEEYNKIIMGTLTDPHFLLLRLQMSVTYALKQMSEFGIGDGCEPLTNPFTGGLKSHVPSDLKTFEASKQYSGKLLWFRASANKFIVGVVIASLLVITLLALTTLRKNKEFILLSFMVIATVLANSWVCGTFGKVYGRYGARAIWLVPLCAVIGLAIRFMAPKPANQLNGSKQS